MLMKNILTTCITFASLLSLIFALPAVLTQEASFNDEQIGVDKPWPSCKENHTRDRKGGCSIVQIITTLWKTPFDPSPALRLDAGPASNSSTTNSSTATDSSISSTTEPSGSPKTMLNKLAVCLVVFLFFIG